MNNEATVNQNAKAEQIAAVNVDMAEAQKKVEECYAQIGKVYVSLHASDYESEFKPYFEQILQAEESIRACRARVRRRLSLRRKIPSVSSGRKCPWL